MSALPILVGLNNRSDCDRTCRSAALTPKYALENEKLLKNCVLANLVTVSRTVMATLLRPLRIGSAAYKMVRDQLTAKIKEGGRKWQKRCRDLEKFVAIFISSPRLAANQARVSTTWLMQSFDITIFESVICSLALLYRGFLALCM